MSQLRCTMCGWKAERQLFVQKTTNSFACPKCKGPCVPIDHLQIATGHTTGASPSAPAGQPASFLGIVTPSDVRAAKDELAPYVEQLRVAASQMPCQSKMTEPLMAGWATWLKGWDTFYASNSTVTSAGNDLQMVQQKRTELAAWSAKIDSLCGESWSVGGVATIAGVAAASGGLTWLARARGAHLWPLVGVAGVLATGAAALVASPKKSTLVPLPPSQKPTSSPGWFSKLEDTAQSASTFAQVAVVVGGVVVVYIVYKQMQFARQIAPSVLDKVQVIPVPL